MYMSHLHLNAPSVGTLLSTAGKLFHVRIVEGYYEYWWLDILENGIEQVWSWPLVVLGGCRSKVHLRWYGYKMVDYPVHHYHFCVGSSLL